MKYQNIIGREEEIATLERLYKSQKSEFVAIYGRRRIGKSYLVSEVYGKKIVFTAVGTFLKVKDEDLDDKKVYEWRYAEQAFGEPAGIGGGETLSAIRQGAGGAGVPTEGFLFTVLPSVCAGESSEERDVG